MLDLAVASPISDAHSLIDSKKNLSALWLNLQYLCHVPYKNGKLENRFESLSGNVKVEYFNRRKTYAGVFYPYEYYSIIENQSIRDDLDNLSKLSDSPIFVTKWDDDTSPTISLAENIFIFRTSAFDFQLNDHEYVMPSWSNNKLRHLDLAAKNVDCRLNSDIVVRPYRVGFCGNTITTYLEELKIRLKNVVFGFAKVDLNSTYYNYFIGRFLRWKSIKKLKKSKEVELVLNASPAFYGGVNISKPRSLLAADLLFLSNALSCDFSLVVRGVGNFSYRLFEVLEIGNVPIIVNSNMTLPLQDIVDWESIAIFWDINSNTNIAETIDQWLLNKHNVSTRKFYQECLEPASFLRLALKR